MGKDLTVSRLLDFYKQLLTDKQVDSLELYYNQDLSLAEIAEHLNITRQGVRDNIKRGEKQLLDYEEKLGLLDKFAEITDICGNINANLDKLLGAIVSDSALAHVHSIRYDIEQIENLV